MRSLWCTALLLAVVGCQSKPESTTTAKATDEPPGTEVPIGDDLAFARKGFVTNLRVRKPAPQPFEKLAPPDGVKEVEYTSGDLKLKGWLSSTADGGAKKPAVVFLHGGFAFNAEDWKDAEPFVKAGFVLFMPTLRGENGNPGVYESFYGEVDDAIAAGHFVAGLPNVDPKQVFVAGHSVGAVMTCLVAMMPSPYRAAAALDGYVDMKSWSAHQPVDLVPYSRAAAAEVRVRNPMAFAASIRCPLRLYAGEEGGEVNALLAVRAKRFGKDCEMVMVKGDHQAMVEPALNLAIAWFRNVGAK